LYQLLNFEIFTSKLESQPLNLGYLGEQTSSEYYRTWCALITIIHSLMLFILYKVPWFGEKCW